MSESTAAHTGRYIATASLDGLLAVWDLNVGDPAVVVKHALPAPAAAAAWHPAANELSATLANGQLMVWVGAIPGHLPPPHIAVPSALLPGAPLALTWTHCCVDE